MLLALAAWPPAAGESSLELQLFFRSLLVESSLAVVVAGDQTVLESVLQAPAAAPVASVEDWLQRLLSVAAAEESSLPASSSALAAPLLVWADLVLTALALADLLAVLALALAQLMVEPSEIQCFRLHSSSWPTPSPNLHPAHLDGDNTR